MTDSSDRHDGGDGTAREPHAKSTPAPEQPFTGSVGDAAGEPGGGAPGGAPDGAPGGAPDGAPTDAAAARPAGGVDTEADILRGELKRLREQHGALQQELDDATDRVLRVRAEMETMRRRLLGEVEQAREQGRDEVLAPVLAVYDDLERALAVAAEAEGSTGIVTGVEMVKENLERQLASLGIRRVGRVGEPFDPHLHEALTTIPAGPGREPGVIAEVFQPGFVQGERLVRVARVVVVAERGN